MSYHETCHSSPCACDEPEKTPWSVELFLSDLKKKEQEIGVDSAIELSLQVMDYFMLAARTQEEEVADYARGEMQKILDLLTPADHDPSVLWGILVQAWQGQRIGLVYPPFLAKVEQHFIDNRIFESDKNYRPGHDEFESVRGVPDGPTLGDIARAVGGNEELF